MNYLAGIVLLMAACLVQADDARSWLDRMSHALKELNYQGVLIYGDARRWETMSFSHAVHDDTEYEKLIHLTGEPREVIRRGHAVSCTHPGDHVVRLSPSSSNPLAAEFARQHGDIEGWYQLALGPQERIAGRAAQVVRVIPKDNHRFGYDLWLDVDTALLLRSDLVRQDGVVLERLQFADIDIGIALPREHFSAQQQRHHMARHLKESAAAPTQASVNWSPTWLPAGFMPSAGGDDHHPGHLSTVMYTDGMAAFSVFVDHQADVDVPSMRQQWGATSAVVRHVEHSGERYRITVVGEVPMATAEKIAASMRGPWSVGDQP
ncbi:sigma factor AlgU regulatory protein MucB [Bacterioplanes sanyensis]|uniref:MucB/RseB C-terminal domain-containing protein n=1 Tax=Bacterioplanes sanyensis TaxID=1249553 RepID=UPI001679FBC6|nr:MucB/RseB C-terminal domain-containing protein [Bacterioplanes sanyensis]GGY45232.1 sigma factor AlgU regulatory protein MucB [Bacterioplanes sanyensis]